MTTRRILRVLGAPMGVAVVVISLVITWGMRKRAEYVHQFDGLLLTYVGLDLIEGDSFLGRRYTTIEAKDPQGRYWLRVDYAGPGYNHFVSWFPDGTVQCEGECLVDFPIPEWELVRSCKCYKLDGELASQVVDGNGTQTWYDAWGRKYWEVVFVNGAVVRKTGWYANGQIWQSHTYANGVFEGHHQTFHRNGALRSDGNYIGGRKSGTWKWYDESGNLEREEHVDETQRMRLPVEK